MHCCCNSLHSQRRVQFTDPLKGSFDIFFLPRIRYKDMYHTDSRNCRGKNVVKALALSFNGGGIYFHDMTVLNFSAHSWEDSECAFLKSRHKTKSTLLPFRPNILCLLYVFTTIWAISLYWSNVFSDFAFVQILRLRCEQSSSHVRASYVTLLCPC